MNKEYNLNFYDLEKEKAKPSHYSVSILWAQHSGSFIDMSIKEAEKIREAFTEQ